MTSFEFKLKTYTNQTVDYGGGRYRPGRVALRRSRAARMRAAQRPRAVSGLRGERRWDLRLGVLGQKVPYAHQLPAPHWLWDRRSGRQAGVPRASEFQFFPFVLSSSSSSRKRRKRGEVTAVSMATALIPSAPPAQDPVQLKLSAHPCLAPLSSS
jgi:hypothetical protein